MCVLQTCSQFCLKMRHVVCKTEVGLTISRIITRSSRLNIRLNWWKWVRMMDFMCSCFMRWPIADVKETGYRGIHFKKLAQDRSVWWNPVGGLRPKRGDEAVWLIDCGLKLSDTLVFFLFEVLSTETSMSGMFWSNVMQTTSTTFAEWSTLEIRLGHRMLQRYHRS